MNTEKELINILSELKDNDCICGVKTEFEAEGSTFEEAAYLKSLSDELDLDFTVKIGGCEAINDLYLAKNLGASTIVAPMIETPYSLKKFVNAVNSVCDSGYMPKKGINLETKNTIKNLDSIISIPEFTQISTVIIGRADLVSSMGLSKDKADSFPILHIVNNLSTRIDRYGKEFIVGGNLIPDSIPILKHIHNLDKFETRKIIFKSETLRKANASELVIKALDFEILWLQNRFEHGINRKSDSDRIEHLNKIITLSAVNK